MVAIEQISIAFCEINEIPKNAFRPLNGQQNNLTLLFFDENKINHISNNSFNFLKKSDKPLIISLRSNSLNSSSFELSAFNNMNRRTTIDLLYNKISYLDQTVFQLFFNDNNNNIININSLDCEDCRSFWLFKNTTYSQSLGISCSDGKMFLNNNNFKKCTK